MNNIFRIIAWLLLAGCASHPALSAPLTDNAIIYVDLQEGFTGEVIRVYIDGQGVFDGKPMTDLPLGQAELISASAATTNITMTIEAPERHFKSERNVDLEKGTFLGVSLTTNDVYLIQRTHPFTHE